MTLRSVVDYLEHWLLRPTHHHHHGAGSSVTGSASGAPSLPPERVLDRGYIKSLFEDAPDNALEAARSIIVEIQRERRRSQTKLALVK